MNSLNYLQKIFWFSAQNSQVFVQFHFIGLGFTALWRHGTTPQDFRLNENHPLGRISLLGSWPRIVNSFTHQQGRPQNRPYHADFFISRPWRWFFSFSPQNWTAKASDFKLDVSPRYLISDRTSAPSVLWDFRSEIGCLSQWDIRFEIENWIEVRFQKKETSNFKKVTQKNGRKRASYNPWVLWPDPCGARLDPGIKPLRLPRGRSATVRDRVSRTECPALRRRSGTLFLGS